MKQQSIIYGVIGLVMGVLLTGFVMGSQNNKAPEKSDSKMTHETSTSEKNSSMSMEEMMSGLKGKTGDDFDKAFLTAMISHHTDALTMAKDAKEKAKRDEIKKLSDNIIEAQTSEIDQMKKWQKDWGFTQ